MANTNAPNGLNQYGGVGSSPTYEQVQMAIAATDTRPIFFGDPVILASAISSAATPGAPTGFVTQATPYIVLSVGATGLATSATGVLTITTSGTSWSVGGSTITGGNDAVPTNWVPPVGSQVVISGAAAPSLNGIYTVGSATATTVVCLPSSSTPTSATSTASGVVQLFVPVAGVFIGCKYLSVANKWTVWRNFWPGSDANPLTSVTAYVVNDPNARFDVQAANSNTTMTTPVGLSGIGQNIGFAFASGAGASGNGNTANGLSTAFVDQYTLQGFGGLPVAPQLLPFRVLELKNYTPDGSNPLQSVNGNDYTTAFNRLIVGFNNSMNKQLFGI